MKRDGSRVAGQQRFLARKRDSGGFHVPTAPTVCQVSLFKLEVNTSFFFLLHRVGVFMISFRTLWMQWGMIHL